MKLRATTGPAKMFKRLDISTVYMKPEEMYLALSTGQIDGVLYGGAAEYKELSFPEVCPYYCTTFVVNPLTDNLLINQKLWDKLPPDLKGIIEAAAYKARFHYYNWVIGEEYKIREKFYKGKTTSLDADSVAKMTAAAQVIWEEEAAKSPLAAEMMEKVKQLLRGLGRLE
jgi:TRAP-type C4-dicarboxylate transport system substrate-binding protein